MSKGNNKTFYESACDLNPVYSFNPWWGQKNVTNDRQYKLAKKYAPGHLVETVAEHPEESFMFLLFVALAEGEEF